MDFHRCTKHKTEGKIPSPKLILLQIILFYFDNKYINSSKILQVECLCPLTWGKANWANPSYFIIEHPCIVYLYPGLFIIYSFTTHDEGRGLKLLCILIQTLRQFIYLVELTLCIFIIADAVSHPRIITWTKQTLNTLRLRIPNGINLVMFGNSNVTFSAKIRKKLRCVFE